MLQRIILLLSLFCSLFFQKSYCSSSQSNTVQSPQVKESFGRNGITRNLSLLLQQQAPMNRTPIGNSFLDFEKIFNRRLFKALDCDSVIHHYLSYRDTTSPHWRVSLDIKSYEGLSGIIKSEIERKLQAYTGKELEGFLPVYINSSATDTGETAIIFRGGVHIIDTTAITAQFSDSGNYLSTSINLFVPVYMKIEFSILIFTEEVLSKDTTAQDHALAYRISNLEMGIVEPEQSEDMNEESEEEMSTSIQWDSTRTVNIHFGIWDLKAVIKNMQWTASQMMELLPADGHEVYAPDELDDRDEEQEPFPFVTIGDIRKGNYKWSVPRPHDEYNFSATLQCVPEYSTNDTIDDSLRLIITQNYDYGLITNSLRLVGDMVLGKEFYFSRKQVHLLHPKLAEAYNFPETYSETDESTLYVDSVIITLPDNIGTFIAEDPVFELNGKQNRNAYRGILYKWKLDISDLMTVFGWQIGIEGTINDSEAWRSTFHCDTLHVCLVPFNNYHLSIIMPSGKIGKNVEASYILSLSNNEIRIKNCAVTGKDTLHIKNCSMINPVFTFNDVSYISNKGFSGTIVIYGDCLTGKQKQNKATIAYDLKSMKLITDFK